MRRPVPDVPGPGQESVWDYPRPPRLETTTEEVEIRLGGEVIARTRRALRMLETSHPPTYYLPLDAFSPGVLRPVEGSSFCEWKGAASYFDVVTASVTVSHAAWTYPTPTGGFDAIRDHIAVMPAEMEACLVGGEVVRPQEGGFYGGWITDRVTGPFKGIPGSHGW